MAEKPLEQAPEAAEEDLVVEDVIEDGLVAGRPVEDRSFEVVEVATGASLGVAIGAVVGGPIGAAAGGIIGGVAGFVAGESIEHAVGRAATTTDATTESDAPVG